MGILSGQIRVPDGSRDLAVAEASAVVVVSAAAEAVSAEGVHPAVGKSGFGKKQRIRKQE